ncbi:MAG TPA: VOC family protein [Iamia sp.]|jgi:hypothetical protein|nr:VOC family protein [Iamia sp.]
MPDPDIEFVGLNLVCGDADVTMGFYRLLGIPYTEDLVWRSATGVQHVTGVDTGATSHVEIDSQALGRHYGAGAETTVLAFRVPTREAVDALHQRMVAAGHPSRQGPFDAFWGARYAIVDDPDGRPVGLMSPQDRALGTDPPDL